MTSSDSSISENLEQLHRRSQLLLAALVGIMAGLVTTLYAIGVYRIDDLTLSLGKMAHQHLRMMVALPLATSVIGAIAAGAVKLSPEASGGGVTHVRTTLLGLTKIQVWPLLPVKFFAGLMALLSGMSLGSEGPSVHLGAIAGQMIGNAFKLSSRKLRPLIAAGSGAGLAAAFNAPLTGFVFVLEEMRKEMSASTFGTALVASVCSVGVLRVILGQSATFHLHNPGPLPLRALPVAVLIGVGGAFIGVMYNRMMLFTMDWRKSKHIPLPMAGGVMGLIAGVVMIELPQITGSGHATALSILTGAFNLSPIILTALVFCFLKLIFTVLCYGTGVPGGIFAPLIVIGGFWGLCFGSISSWAFPAFHGLVPGFAAIGMVAVLVGSVRAPLTATILIVEITGEYGLLFSLLASAFVAYAIAEALGDTPIYDAMLERTISGAEASPSDTDAPILTEFFIEPESALDGIELRSLKLPGNSLIVGVLRANRQMVPNGSTFLLAGDMITIVIDPDHPSDILTLESMSKST